VLFGGLVLRGVAAGVTLLVAATAVGLCGAGAVAAPRRLPLAEQGLQHAALAAAEAEGELRQLEGVSLDAAIEASALTVPRCRSSCCR
jgi:hypothetical protein